MDSEKIIRQKEEEIAQLENKLEQLKKTKASKIAILAEENIIKLGKEITAHRKIVDLKEKELLAMKDIKYAKGFETAKGKKISEPAIVEILEQIKKLESIELKQQDSIIINTGDKCNDVCDILNNMIMNINEVIGKIEDINHQNISKIESNSPKHLKDILLSKNALLFKKKMSSAQNKFGSLKELKDKLEKGKICSCNQ